MSIVSNKDFASLIYIIIWAHDTVQTTHKFSLKGRLIKYVRPRKIFAGFPFYIIFILVLEKALMHGNYVIPYLSGIFDFHLPHVRQHPIFRTPSVPSYITLYLFSEKDALKLCKIIDESMLENAYANYTVFRIYYLSSSSPFSACRDFKNSPSASRNLRD